MSIRIAAATFAFGFAAAFGAAPAAAQANVMKECGAEYQTAKAANALGGKKWNEFLSDCRTRKASATPAAATVPAAPMPAAPATAAPSVPPAPMAPTATAPAKPAATGGRAAMLDRQRACGAEWKAQKVELRKASPNLKWPQFWSDCNKRLKAAAKQ